MNQQLHTASKHMMHTDCQAESSVQKQSKVVVVRKR